MKKYKIVETEKETLYKKIKIGSNTYKVYTCKIIKVNGYNHFGFICYDKKYILIIKDKNFKETLNHEITHAFINEIYLKSKKNKRIIKKLRSDEFFIESLRQLIF